MSGCPDQRLRTHRIDGAIEDKILARFSLKCRKMTGVIARRRSGAVKHPGAGRGEYVPKLSGHFDEKRPDEVLDYR
jgi:hypothetical protein